MVNKLVILIHLEYERVVDIVASEDLHCETRAEENEDDDESEVVRIDTSVDLSPISRHVFVCWAHAQEDKEGEHH